MTAKSKKCSRTYRLEPALAARLDDICWRRLVYSSHLVEFLLTAALDQVDAGTLEIPLQPVVCGIVDAA